MALTKFNYNSFDVTPVASKALAFNSDADGLTTAAEGSMVLIKTLTSDGSDDDLSFVNGTDDVVLDNTYPTYLFKFMNIHPETDGVDLEFNFSVDTGSNYNVTKTTTLFDSLHNETGTNAAVGYSDGRDIAQGTGGQDLLGSVGNGNDESGAGELWLFDPSSTTFVKHFLARTQFYHQSDYSGNMNMAGYGNTTSAIDAGTIKMYGVT